MPSSFIGAAQAPQVHRRRLPRARDVGEIEAWDDVAISVITLHNPSLLVTIPPGVLQIFFGMAFSPRMHVRAHVSAWVNIEYPVDVLTEMRLRLLLDMGMSADFVSDGAHIAPIDGADAEHRFPAADTTGIARQSMYVDACVDLDPGRIAVWVEGVTTGSVGNMTIRKCRITARYGRAVDL